MARYETKSVPMPGEALINVCVPVYSECGQCIKSASAWRVTASRAFWEAQELILKVLMIIEGLCRKWLMCKVFICLFVFIKKMKTQREKLLCMLSAFSKRKVMFIISHIAGWGIWSIAKSCERALLYSQRLGNADICGVILARASFAEKGNIREH